MQKMHDENQKELNENDEEQIHKIAGNSLENAIKDADLGYKCFHLLVSGHI